MGMIKKTIEPIVERFNGTGDLAVVGVKVEYRLMGILLYRSILHYPQKYGVQWFDFYQTSI